MGMHNGKSNIKWGVCEYCNKKCTVQTMGRHVKRCKKFAPADKFIERWHEHKSIARVAELYPNVTPQEVDAQVKWLRLRGVKMPDNLPVPAPSEQEKPSPNAKYKRVEGTICTRLKGKTQIGCTVKNYGNYPCAFCRDDKKRGESEFVGRNAVMAVFGDE